MTIDSREPLLDHAWSLHRPNGDVRSPLIRFNQDGTIDGYNHENESSWRIEDGSLVFRHRSGYITARSTTMRHNARGTAYIEMVREDDRSVKAHILVALDETNNFTQRDSFKSLLSQIQKHPAFGNNCLLGQPGFSEPTIEDLEVIELSESTLPRLAEMGITLVGKAGLFNVIILDKKMPKQNLKLHIYGAFSNIIILDKKSRARGGLHFEGNENVVIIGAACPGRDVNLSAWLRYDRAGLLLGSGGSAGHMNVWIEGPARSVQIGDDSLFSWGIWLRTADSHGLIDLESGAILNPSRSIIIHQHVWLGQDVIVMSGAQIGGGSVVGARSVVTKSLPETSVCVGAPAKVVRTRASWTRSAHPSPEELAALRAQTFDSHVA